MALYEAPIGRLTANEWVSLIQVSILARWLGRAQRQPGR